MTEQQRQAAIEYHRAQIAHADWMCRQGHWSPAAAANHRQSHARLLHELTQR